MTTDEHDAARESIRRGESTLRRIIGIWFVGGLIIVGIYAAMRAGWDLPLPSIDGEWHYNDVLGLGCPYLILGFIFIGGSMSSLSKRRSDLRIAERGIDGVARVIRCTEREGHRNQKPRFDLELEITVAGREPYAITLHRAMHAHLAERLTPGTTRSVRIDPDEEMTMMIEGIDDWLE